MHGIELDPYYPTQNDLEFTRTLVNSLRIGGKWEIPRCLISYEKVAKNKMKLDNYLTPEWAKHMIDSKLVDKKVEELKMAQAMDHHAFKACCAKLGIEVDDSVLNENGHR